MKFAEKIQNHGSSGGDGVMRPGLIFSVEGIDPSSSVPAWQFLEHTHYSLLMTCSNSQW